MAALDWSQLLAMKLSAWRDDLDVEDAGRLLKECRGAREDLLREVEPYVVHGHGMKARFARDDLLESEHGTRSSRRGASRARRPESPPVGRGHRA